MTGPSVSDPEEGSYERDVELSPPCLFRPRELLILVDPDGHGFGFVKGYADHVES